VATDFQRLIDALAENRVEFVIILQKAKRSARRLKDLPDLEEIDRLLRGA
jgi:hypothetical protein